jgi:TfoX/Sxy family transcriptional regulator of competence genes
MAPSPQRTKWPALGRKRTAQAECTPPPCPARAWRTIAAVAYDEDLADRIRELLGGVRVREQKMFGGLGFLVGGNMAIAASGQGGLLVRVDPVHSDRLVKTTAARPMEMRGRQMQGWLRVPSDKVRTKQQLSKWVKLGTTYARSLPAK